MFLRKVIFINVCLLELKDNFLNAASDMVLEAWHISKPSFEAN